MTLPRLRLKANADRRLRAGHLWVYSNEVDVAATPLNGFAAGDQAVLEAAGGKPLGVVALSPNNLICARLLSRDAELALDKSLLVHRLNVALSLRERLFDTPFYRLVYGDADLLPGLVVDRFGDILVVQLASATMERNKDAVLEALLQVLKPRGVLWKNDSAARDAEGLERYVDVAHGDVPDWVALEENGVKFEAPVRDGQKTGWFYDHRMNRARLAPYVKGKRVLDLFSYIGGWGIQAAAFGASEVVCVDASEFALDGVERNAALNGLSEVVASIEGDVFEALRELKAAEERFDVVVADPPAFIKRKKDLKNGEAAYRRLNEQAMRLLNKDGILVSASCSMHLPEDDLQGLLLGSARHLDRTLQLLERGGQGPDHPVHPAIPETRYIKSLTCRLLPNA
ncbi:class I SAM-dependent rRNA methyltransferase [Pseudomonas mangiferae]|uniref:Class I SAM-dependent rRNA methyltransferase n=1 Tax=Pseudomonas mangiferae TaxID=2593654 RepID=A0A553GVZ0_9PSED|nr:class I SAM-dependent rRNA methyltransferase [Pseudomonas mangiferae]TRX73626.1 class I SAM-dependent rRNA methyltransferase [Pseudomonas mangiferae]